MFVNLYTVRLIIKALGLVDYGLFNTIAGVITTSAFISGVLTLSIQRFYSVALGRQDKEELKKALRRMLENPELCRKLGENARRKAESGFSIESSIEQLVSIYRDLLSE